MISQLNMEMLLRETGFRIRGKRADCQYCTGRSRLTVSFTDEVAYCHRCNWKSNSFTLSKERVLLDENSAAAEIFQREQRERRIFRVEIAALEQWLDSNYWRVADRYRLLGHAAQKARTFLQENPNDETAWEALASFYHWESKLAAAMDYLTFAKASQWLESDSHPSELFLAWRENVAA
jgi:hypothetical protein